MLVLECARAQADVAADRAAEEKRILQHDAEAAAQVAEVHFFHVDAVDADCALLHVVEAQQQRNERGLAGAGVADYGDGFSGLDGEGDVAEDPVGLRFGVAIAEAALLRSAGRARRAVATWSLLFSGTSR